MSPPASHDWPSLGRACLLLLVAAGAAPLDAVAESAPHALMVGDQKLEARDFEEALQIVIRRRYFHGNVPAEALPALRSEARQALIDRTLLLAEARRRQIPAESTAADRTLAEFESRNRGTKDWPKRRERVRQRLIDDARIDALYELERRAMPAPTDAELRRYYQANPDVFTEPQKQRVAVILLGVEPSAASAQWQAARREAAQLHAELRRGADFAALARLRSSDSSAQAGGDMGYLHRGMLPEAAQAAIDKLQPGELTEPLTLLSGVAVFRLSERQSARLMPYATVRERAKELWSREEYDRRSQSLIQRLRADAVIRVAGDGQRPGS